MSLVPAQGESLIARLLRALFGGGPAPHESVRWDTDGRCDRAVCSVCGEVKGVSIRDRMLPHGPHANPCRGTGGGTTFPVVGPGNSGLAYRAKNRALAGRRRRRGKR